MLAQPGRFSFESWRRRRSAPPAGPSGSRAFTLVELLIAIGIIALLVSILAPTVARMRHMARRVVCLTRLASIGRGTHAYAAENHGDLFHCRYRWVQIALNPRIGSSGNDAIDWAGAAASVGLQGKAWECPDRPGSCQWEMEYPQLIIGYQYFGGVEEWTTPWGVFPSRSPCNVYRSKEKWVLAADCMMKIDQVWGGGRPSAYGNMPPHRWKDPWPEGGNQVYADGSADWVPFEKTLYIHSWGYYWRMAYFYQEDLGEYDPPEEAKARP